MMPTAYIVGRYLGGFIAAALICGLVPFIILAYKKHWGMGFFCLAVCGVLHSLGSVVSVVAGVVFLIHAVTVYNNRA